MNTLKTLSMLGFVMLMPMSFVHAEDVVTLPTIRPMVDAELRKEVVTRVTPLQEDAKVRKALQHQIMKKEQDVQNGVRPNLMADQTAPETDNLPDMSKLNPMQQAYVLSVASSFQSSDPMAGMFKMPEPLRIDRDKALDSIRMGTPLEFKLDENILNQLSGR